MFLDYEKLYYDEFMMVMWSSCMVYYIILISLWFDVCIVYFKLINEN